MASLRGKSASPSTIDLYGVIGAFRIAESPYCIRYFSTFANPSGNGGHAKLVSELKPMRDRIRAADLSDLSSLMQRDLNDMRVAHELVPYLEGLRSQVGFFPAILAVIVPKNFLSSSSEIRYPKPSQDPADENKKDYEGHWYLTQYSVEDKETPLGMLQIVDTKAEVIVLDGQHRASAFRFVSGDFDPTGTVYQAFYDDVPTPRTFNADLPVTLVWFESDQTIEPRLISRSLFVDVNNNAKRVSAARNILLDDRTLSCVGTQAFYNIAAERRFAPGMFSLLHSAFDMDSDLADRHAMSRFTLTTPEIIEEALRWALFGTTAYDEVFVWTVKQMRAQRNTARFAQFFPDVDGYATSENQDEEVVVYFEDFEDAKAFRGRFKENFLPVLTQLFDGLSLLAPHYEAGQKIDDWIASETTSTYNDIWRDVFCGGEGLYYSLTAPESVDSPRWQNFTKTIAEIEQRFSDERRAAFGADRNTVDGVYQAFVTKAFQVGFVMAVDYLVRKSVAADRISAADKLIGGLNNFSLQNWVVVFEKFRPLIIGSGGTIPRAWPAYRNLLIRMYDNDKQQIFDGSNIEQSPDWRACEESLRRAASNYVELNDDMPEDTEVDRLTKNELEKVMGILENGGLKTSWFTFDAISTIGNSFLERELRRRFGTT